MGEISLGKCIVCGEIDESSQDAYCASHATALRQMYEAYKTWSSAYGGIRLEQFLSRLSELPEAGDRVKELSKFLAENVQRWAG